MRTVLKGAVVATWQLVLAVADFVLLDTANAGWWAGRDGGGGSAVLGDADVVEDEVGFSAARGVAGNSDAQRLLGRRAGGEDGRLLSVAPLGTSGNLELIALGAIEEGLDQAVVVGATSELVVSICPVVVKSVSLALCQGDVLREATSATGSPNGVGNETAMDVSKLSQG